MFYNPFEGQDQQFNGWKAGTNDVAIVAVNELTGDKLANKLRWLSEASDKGTTFKKLDINLVITIGKESYEYTKDIVFAYSFERNDDGTLDTKSKSGKMNLRRAVDMFNMLFTKPKLGLNQHGNVISETGTVIANLASYLQTTVNKNNFNHLAYMVKGAKYWDVKLLANKTPDAVLAYEKQALYWNNRTASEPTTSDTSFDFGANQSKKEESDNPFIS